MILAVELCLDPGILYHHGLHKSDLLSIMTSIPTIHLKREVVHTQRIKLPRLRFPHRLQRVLPESAVALGKNVAWRLEMAGGVRAYP